MSSIIVIGNGPSVLNNKFGHIIDSFEEVARINHYKPIKEHSGEKLTLFCTSPYDCRYNPKVPELAKEILIWDELENEKTKYDACPHSRYIDKRPVSTELESKHGFKTYPGRPYPSTGVSLLMYLIQLNKYKTIFIYGFDNLQLGKKIHFFDSIIQTKTSPHSPELERKFIEFYINTGLFVRLEDHIASGNLILASSEV